MDNKLQFYTSRFGHLEIETDRVITFPEGLLGFPKLKRYLLLDHKDTVIKWLQSIDDPDVAFIVVEPAHLFPDFTVNIDHTTKELLEINENNDGIVVMLIIRVENDKVIANKNGPLVFNANLMRGIQMINE
ncbi:Flagellar assembly factor FliW [Candidatus Magnetoovum chiemensis]|nr:Flagellar assembly factor FliW [Candidatus Magnetoovum chiemensis]